MSAYIFKEMLVLFELQMCYSYELFQFGYIMDEN